MQTLEKLSPAAWNVYEQGRTKGLHLGAQFYVSQQGMVLVDHAVGENQPGESLTRRARMPWLSAGKPLTAVALARCVEQLQLHWDDPVQHYVPALCGPGTEQITLRHLLCHSSNILPLVPDQIHETWDDAISRITGAPLDSRFFSGEGAAYQPQNTWYLLGAILAQVCQLPFAAALEELVLQPLKLTETTLGVQDSSDFLDAESPGQIGLLYEKQAGQLTLLNWHRPPRCTSHSPGSSLRGPIHNLGRFYEALLEDYAGANQLLSPGTLHELVSRQRIDRFDDTLKHKIDLGMGFLINSKRYGAETVPYGYGNLTSEETFGHGGAQCSQGYADPVSGIVVAYVFNGRPGEAQHHRRIKEFNNALVADLLREV